jgi:signal transduction histidine kinase
MKPSAQAQKASLTAPTPESEKHIAELEARLAQLTSQLKTANDILVSEIANRTRKEEEFHRSTEQLRELSARVQSVREDERTHIARVIHDELGQTLTGLKMDVAWLQRHLDQSPSALLEKTEAMSDLIDATIQTVRRISTELRPGILDDLGLTATIEWQLQELQSRSGITGILSSAPEETTLSVDGATTAFRIFQEILTNLTRHAQASQVEVLLEESGGYLLLQVRDNGRGISQAEIDSPKSIGLLGMQERARLRAGEVHFQGRPGQGTTETVRLPLTTEEANDKSTHRR